MQEAPKEPEKPVEEAAVEAKAPTAPAAPAVPEPSGGWADQSDEDKEAEDEGWGVVGAKSSGYKKKGSQEQARYQENTRRPGRGGPRRGGGGPRRGGPGGPRRGDINQPTKN